MFYCIKKLVIQKKCLSDKLQNQKKKILLYKQTYWEKYYLCKMNLSDSILLISIHSVKLHRNNIT